MNTHTALHPAMPGTGTPQWSGARWVGSLDLPVLAPDAIALDHADGFSWARLLVREHDLVRGFIEVPITHGAVDTGEVAVAVGALPIPAAPPTTTCIEPVTVVVCTRDRAAMLSDALRALLAVDHPNVEIVVVDNAPSDDTTARLIAALDEQRVRYIREPRPGLARARNRGLLVATHDVVAFTDDDVIVHPYWLRGLLAGFARGSDVACVSGLVPAGELRTPTQAAFEERVGWTAVHGQTFRLSAPPAGLPLFPYQVGSYGTGASFAVRRHEIVALGGFDEALGAGSPTRGGEDIDLFFRVVTAGYALAYEPAAIAWHRHRSDSDALLDQAIGYGTGLGAWLAKIARSGRTLWPALRRALAGTRRLASLGSDASAPVDPDLRAALARASRAERLAVLRGALRYSSARRAARKVALLDGGTSR